eukprot:478171-Amphidinium_carterae.11
MCGWRRTSFTRPLEVINQDDGDVESVGNADKWRARAGSLQVVVPSTGRPVNVQVACPPEICVGHAIWVDGRSMEHAAIHIKSVSSNTN